MIKHVAAIAIGLAATSAATADSVTMKFLGTGQGRSVKITALGNTFNVFSGQLKHQITSGTGEGQQLVGEHRTFCTDLAQYVNKNSNVYQIVPVSELPKNHAQGEMGEARAQAIQDLYDFADRQQIAANANVDFAAAFQLAVWEIVCDYNANLGLASLDLEAGSFRARETNGNQLSLAVRNNLLAFFGAIGSNAGMSGLRGLSNDCYQDQLVLVPLPAPALIGAAGLGFAYIARRRLARR